MSSHFIIIGNLIIWQFTNIPRVIYLRSMKGFSNGLVCEMIKIKIKSLQRFYNWSPIGDFHTSPQSFSAKTLSEVIYRKTFYVNNFVKSKNFKSMSFPAKMHLKKRTKRFRQEKSIGKRTLLFSQRRKSKCIKIR